LPPSAATSNSRFNPSFQDALQGGAAAIAGGSDGGWALPIGSLVLGLRHVGLSGYNPTVRTTPIGVPSLMFGIGAGHWFQIKATGK
jgi:hypothetical protein